MAKEGARGLGGRRVREDTVQERDLDAIFKSGATSILSLSSPSTEAPPSSLRGRQERTVGYPNTESAPRSDLNPGSSPCSPCVAPTFPEFRFGASTYGEFPRGRVLRLI